MSQPQRFTGRAGSKSSGRVRRALDGAIDTQRRNGDTLDVVDGRLDVKLARGTALRVTRTGLDIAPSALGDKNRDSMSFVRDAATGATAADLVTKVNELLAELRRTKRMHGGTL
jgi:hypothetical protein